MENQSNENSEHIISVLITKLIHRLKKRVLTDNLKGVDEELRMFIKLHKSQIKLNKKLLIFIKESLSEFIVKENIPLIETYELLFHDDKFNNYIIKKDRIRNSYEDFELPPISAEEMINIENWTKNNSKWTIIKKLNKFNNSIELEKVEKKLNKFKIGQIIGARDKERKWWLSRILYIFEDPNYPYPWYYVSFEGWGDLYNEWISSPHRIKPFNPRRDLLKR